MYRECQRKVSKIREEVGTWQKFSNENKRILKELSWLQRVVTAFTS